MIRLQNSCTSFCRTRFATFVIYSALLYLIVNSHSYQGVEAFQQSNNENSLRLMKHHQRQQSYPKQQLTPIQHTLPSSSKRSSPSSSSSLFMWSSDDELEGSDKFKACFPYMLPLLDGEPYGQYIYDRIPPLGFLDSLFVGPLYEIYSHVPFLGLLFFLALTLGTRGLDEMSRGVRFSAQQAAMIDVALVGPELIRSAFEGEDIPRYIAEPCMTFVWYTYMSMVLYSIYSNLRGKKPDQIPYISGFAELLLGPF